MLESEFKLAVMSLVSYKIFQKPKMLNFKKLFNATKPTIDISDG